MSKSKQLLEENDAAAVEKNRGTKAERSMDYRDDNGWNADGEGETWKRRVGVGERQKAAPWRVFARVA